jgi:hypothetical protein
MSLNQLSSVRGPLQEDRSAIILPSSNNNGASRQEKINLDDNGDVQFISRNTRNFQLPENGVDIPQQIILPLVTASKPVIIQFGTSLGISMPQSSTRQVLLERIRDILLGFGFQEISNNTFIRSRGVKLQLINQIIENSREKEDIHIPEMINSNIFDTMGTISVFIGTNNLNRLIPVGTGRLKNDIARDLKELLFEQGYSIDPWGNFIKKGGSIISGGFEFNDLITPQDYAQFLNEVSQIQIEQSDLSKLNISINDLKRRWKNFNDFVKETAKNLSVPETLIKLSSLLLKLQHEDNKSCIAILRSIGDIRPHRKMEDRVNAILEHFRRKINPMPRSYVAREIFNGPALTTMTLDEAIKGGYQFDDNQYKNQISELLNRSQVPSNQRDTFIKLIQIYPEMFDVIRSYGNQSTSFTHALIRLYYNEVPGMVQQLYTYAVNYPLSFPETPEKASRRQALSVLPRAYLDSLYFIYATRDLEVILDIIQNPLELYLIEISRLKVDQLPALVYNIGMTIPEHLLTRDKRQYILQFIHEYRSVITRPADIKPINKIIRGQPGKLSDFISMLDKYTDQEIMTYFGYIGGFENRNTLINQIFRNINEEGFMVYKNIDHDAAVNVETTLLTPISDILGPYLVFGTPFAYRVLELEELLEAFYEDKNKQEEIMGFKFMKIGGEFTDTYSISQVSRLQTLLPAIRDMNPQLSTMVDSLLEKIRLGIVRTMRRNAEIDALIRDVKSATIEIQSVIKEIFYKIFYAGMYMRRWKGPGTQYPLAQSATKSGGNPQSKTILALGEVFELFNKLRVIEKTAVLQKRLRTVPEIDYNTLSDVIIIRSNTYLFNLIDQVIKEDQCIRVASRRIVITANYYISVMFGEVIPNFDPHSVDPIS